MGLLSGCGGDDDDASTGTNASGELEKATISLAWHANNKERIQPLIDGFNKSQSVVTVKSTYLPYDQYTSTLQTQLQSGSAPDVFTIAVANALPLAIWPVGEAGKLLDLSGEPWAAGVSEDYKDLVSVDGKVYGLPFPSGLTGLFNNVALFDELGLEVPERFSDLLAMCKKAAAAGKVPIAAGFADTVASMNYNLLGMSNNVYSQEPDWTELRNEGKETFTGSAGWRRAFEQLVEMQDADCFAESPQGLTETQAHALFAKGDAVLLLGAASNVPAIKTLNPEIKIDGFPLPADDPADTLIPQITPQGMVASADTKYPEQVKAFFDYAAQTEQQRLAAAPGGGILPEDMKAGNLPDYLQGYVPLVKKGQYIILPNATWPDPSLTNAAAQPVAGLFTGQSSVDSVLKDLDAAWDEAIEKK